MAVVIKMNSCSGWHRRLTSNLTDRGVLNGFLAESCHVFDDHGSLAPIFRKSLRVDQTFGFLFDALATTGLKKMSLKKMSFQIQVKRHSFATLICNYASAHAHTHKHTHTHTHTHTSTDR